MTESICWCVRLPPPVLYCLYILLVHLNISMIAWEHLTFIEHIGKFRCKVACCLLLLYISLCVYILSLKLCWWWSMCELVPLAITYLSFVLIMHISIDLASLLIIFLLICTVTQHAVQ